MEQAEVRVHLDAGVGTKGMVKVMVRQTFQSVVYKGKKKKKKKKKKGQQLKVTKEEFFTRTGLNAARLHTGQDSGLQVTKTKFKRTKGKKGL